MRLVLALAALAASASVASAVDYPARPKCTPAGTKQFVDALNAASNGCTASNTYQWDGNNDPTTDQRTAFCKCAVAPFNIPKCSWIKADIYNVSVNEHFHYVYNCDVINGKQAPNVTEIDAVVGTVAPSSGDTCTALQTSNFTTALKTSSSCIASSTYDWAGTTDPTDAQFSEICKCSVGSDFTIPSCTLTKAGTKVSLSVHYNWVIKTKCPQITAAAKGTSGGTGGTEKKSSSNMAMIAGIIGGVVVVIAVIIGFVVCKRKSSAKSDANDMRSPATYQPMESTPQSNNKSNGGVTTIATTITTTNGSMNPSGNGTGSYGTGASGRSTETGKWDDPVVMAVRIPFDAIFVGSLLSKGGFGEVHRGTYRGETVAIKSLLPERRKDLTQIDDFLSEVKLMSSLEHERIVKFIGVAWNSLSDACMVVEFMENGDLRSLLGRWESGPEQRPNGFDADKVKIAMHVAHALVYLHSLNPVVVHRDLKSKNVLLDANLDAKLTDFGISRERADATMTAGVGSSLWMAPEVMMGQRYDEKADIFSFGVVLSELDTHQLPYFHAKVTETGQKLPEAAILQQVMLGRISVGFTDRAHPELVKLGRECVSVDPKQRPTTAQVLHRVHTIMREFQ